MTHFRHGLLGLTLFLAAGLVAVPGPVRADDDTITAAQPSLAKQPLAIVDDKGQSHKFQVEMALTPHEQEVGLMFRKEVPADGGMLFVFPVQQEGQFWMKNTLVPLDMVFINADGTIRSISENTVPLSLGVDDSGGPILAVLELQGGLTEKLDISVGDKVITEALHNAK